MYIGYIIFGIVALISWVISASLQSKFKKYSKIPIPYGMTGKMVAEKMLHDHGNHNSQLIFFVRNGYVLFLANERDAICVYNAMGQKILSKMAVQGLNVISLNIHGVIVLKVGDKVTKAIL